MATRSRTTFKKRQKEIARMEWQREKAAKRMQRKQHPEKESPEVKEEQEPETGLTPAEPSQVGE
jgi:hypothetical protein